MVDLPNAGRIVAGLVIVALRSFFGTLLLTLCLGLVLAGSIYYLLGQRQPWYGWVGAVVAMLEAGVVGLVWAAKRAAMVTLVHALQRHRIGRAAVRLIFERLLSISGQQGVGECGGQVARAAEQVPLAQAEKWLSEAVSDMLSVPATGGAMMSRVPRWLKAKLLRRVQACALAQFRAPRGTRYGSVDLRMVRADLETRLDDLLIARLTRGLNLWTLFVLIGLPCQVFATVYVALAFLQ